jgi:hypothetical protein
MDPGDPGAGQACAEGISRRPTLTRVPAYRTPTEQLTGGYPRRSKLVDDNVTRTKSTGGYRTTPAIAAGITNCSDVDTAPAAFAR